MKVVGVATSEHRSIGASEHRSISEHLRASETMRIQICDLDSHRRQTRIEKELELVFQGIGIVVHY